MNPKYIMLRDNVERVTNEENEYKKLKDKGLKLIGGTEVEKVKAEGDKKEAAIEAEYKAKLEAQIRAELEKEYQEKNAAEKNAAEKEAADSKKKSTKKEDK